MADIDQRIEKLIKQINEKKANIGRAENPSWKTNRAFSFTEDPKDNINLNTVRDVATLIRIAGFLKYRERAYHEGAEFLGVSKPPAFTWQGFPASDWLDDLKVNVTKLQIATERKKLEELEARLDKIISPEKRRELELAAIERELS